MSRFKEREVDALAKGNNIEEASEEWVSRIFGKNVRKEGEARATLEEKETELELEGEKEKIKTLHYDENYSGSSKGKQELTEGFDKTNEEHEAREKRFKEEVEKGIKEGVKEEIERMKPFLRKEIQNEMRFENHQAAPSAKSAISAATEEYTSPFVGHQLQEEYTMTLSDYIKVKSVIGGKVVAIETSPDQIEIVAGGLHVKQPKFVVAVNRLGSPINVLITYDEPEAEVPAGVPAKFLKEKTIIQEVPNPEKAFSVPEESSPQAEEKADDAEKARVRRTTKPKGRA